MASERWTYRVERFKPGFFGFSSARLEECLNQLGMQGWELIAAVQTHSLRGAMPYLKKPLA